MTLALNVQTLAYGVLCMVAGVAGTLAWQRVREHPPYDPEPESEQPAKEYNGYIVPSSQGRLAASYLLPRDVKPSSHYWTLPEDVKEGKHRAEN